MRDLIEQKLVPDDVTLMVLTQAREELIRRTVESLRGARRAIVHVYNATAPVWRKVVFGMTVPEVMQLVAKQVGLIKTLTDAMPETEWVLEYSPETFSMTELPVALEACNTAIRAWNAGPGRPDHREPADHGGERHAQRLRRPDRVDVRRTSSGASTSRCRCTRTTIAAPASRPPSSACWRARIASKVACSAMASAPAMSTW